MDSSQAKKNSRPDITSEVARETRARAWRFIFDCHARKEVASVDGGKDDAKEDKDVRAKDSIPR